MLPVPPIGLTVDPNFEHMITLVMATIGLGALVFAIWHWVLYKRPVVLLMVVAGGLMMVMEPLVDTVGGCWFALNSHFAIHGYGRGTPVWCALNYVDFFGIGGGLLWIAMRRGISRLQLQLWFCGFMVADILTEIPLLQHPLYAYYGSQPLVVANFPLWWAPVNSLVVIAASAVVLQISNSMKGLALLAIIPAMLCASAAANAAAGWPSWFVINSSHNALLTQAGGIASLLLSVAIVHWVGGFVANKTAVARAPAELGGRYATGD